MNMAQDNEVYEIKTQPKPATMLESFSPDQVEKWVMGEATLGQLYGMSIEEAYSIAELGYTFAEQGRLADAQTVFLGLVVSNPYDAYFHTMLGSIFQKQDNLPGAVEEYTIAIGLDPANVEAYVNRGELLMRLGNFEQAASDFKNAAELDPNGTNPSVNRARILATVTASALKSAIDGAK
jgi:tetratricopeptide (TPR) repeat protein